MRVKEDIHFTNYALSIMNYALCIKHYYSATTKSTIPGSDKSV